MFSLCDFPFRVLLGTTAQQAKLLLRACTMHIVTLTKRDLPFLLFGLLKILRAEAAVDCLLLLFFFLVVVLILVLLVTRRPRTSRGRHRLGSATAAAASPAPVTGDDRGGKDHLGL